MSTSSDPKVAHSRIDNLSDQLDASDDIPSFLNDILSPSSPDDLGSLEKAVSDLLTQLSLLGQDTSAQIEDSIHDISRNVPRLTYDLQFMRESAETVKQSLQTVQYRVKGISGGETENQDEETIKIKKVLNQLTELDMLKSRMEESRDVLREAESWSTLESETLSFLSAQEYRKAANRLHEASESIQVFQNTPAEYAERKAVLTSLQNDLEERLMNSLNEAVKKEGEKRTARETARKDEETGIETKEVEDLDLQEIFKIFGLIQREKEFRTGYFKARRQNLLSTWADTTIIESGLSSGSGPTSSLPSLLNSFISQLQQILVSESTQMPRIFPDPLHTLRLFLQSTLESLSPCLPERLRQVVEHHGQRALLSLIELWQTVEEFGRTAQDLFSKMAGDSFTENTASPGMPGTPAKGGSGGRRSRTSSISSMAGAGGGGVRTVQMERPPRRMSRILGDGAMSISGTAVMMPSISTINDTEIHTASISPWEAPLYEPFMEYQADYAGLERRFLLDQLRSETTFSKSALLQSDAAKVVHERSNRAMQMAEEAMTRCLAFTHGYGLAGLCEAIDFIIDTCMKESGFVLDVIGMGSSGKITEAELKDTSMRDELDDLGDLETDDYGPFEAGLKVIQSCKVARGRFEEMVGKLEEQILASKKEMAHLRSGANVSPPGTATVGTPKQAPIGARLLLQQSNLNSMELALILDSTSRDSHLPGSKKALSDFTKESQSTLQKIILTPMYGLLSTYPSLPIWSQPEKVQRKGELYVPTFSLSPTDTISQVSERLLNLLRLFEVYAGEEALGFSLETLPFVNVETLREMVSEQLEQETTSNVPRTSPSLLTHTSPTHILTPTESKSASSRKPDLPTQFPPEIVLSTWISSLALSLLAHLTRSVLPSIKTPLTVPGNAQLASDLGYLANAIRALDVEWEELDRWREKAEAASGVQRESG